MNQVPLQAAKGLAAGVGGRLGAREVLAGRRAHAPLVHRQPVEGAVELAVAGAIEAVAAGDTTHVGQPETRDTEARSQPVASPEAIQTGRDVVGSAQRL